jgi:hypothetical protein
VATNAPAMSDPNPHATASTAHCASHDGVPRTNRSPRPPPNASMRSSSHSTPTGRPTNTVKKSSHPAACDPDQAWNACKRWCGPHVNAMNSHAIPKCENPNTRQSRFISRPVITP